MLTTLFFAAILAGPAPTCGAAQVAQANADLATSARMQASADPATQATGAELQAAAEESRADAIAACTPTGDSARANPFEAEDAVDPFAADESEDGDAQIAYDVAVQLAELSPTLR